MIYQEDGAALMYESQEDEHVCKLQQALHLIKLHISNSGSRSRDLHEAIQLIVDVVRPLGYLQK